MARLPEGWKLRLPKGRTVYIVRFTVNGRRVDRSTGTEDPEQAASAAARIYADFVQREPQRRRIVRRGDSPPVEELVAAWLEGDSTIDEDTVDTWTVYGGHWAGHFETMADVTEVTCEDYRNKRLRVVQASTVRKELSALRRFVRWCHDRAYLPREIKVPGVPAKATGTRYRKRRRGAAPDVSPRQIETVIASLPEWSTSKKVKPFPIRPRFVVAYETGLRPSTLDNLSVPEHYHKGASTVTITDEIDKARWGRELPLSEAARAALDSVCPDEGLIFGAHDYRWHLKEAVTKALPAAKASKFCSAHFRSAMITHELERTGNLPGIQYRVGHLQAKTTGGYVRPSFRAAEASLRRRSADSGDAAEKKA